MTVEALDHINIRTGDVEATVRFLAELLELTAGPMPGVTDPAMGAWLSDASGRAIVHVNAAAMFGEQPRATVDTGALHHVALACRGREAMVARLDRLGIPYQANDVRAAGVRQLFVREPNGLLLELNFRDG
jgi:catechol 2,3-dioxygenase-like lactoylglutathione lyase family enzyme